MLVKVCVLLADKGTATTVGTLNLLNVGWSVTQLKPVGMPKGAPLVAIPSPTGPQTVVVFLEAELAMCNKQLNMEIELLNEDGKTVELPGPVGTQAMRIQQSIMIPSPPGVPTGFPGRMNSMIELGQGLPLAPGVYRWQVRINGDTHDDWSVSFFVAPPPQPATFGVPPLA